MTQRMLWRGTTHSQMELFMPDQNVIAVSFAEQAKAFQAFSELKGADREGRVEVKAAAVVARDELGRLTVPDGADPSAGEATRGGGLIGMLVGVLGGPIGMLFGWTGGMLVGSAFDAKRAANTDSVLGAISDFIPPGGTALVAEVDEVATEVVDQIMTPLGGTVHLRSADDVLADLEAAEDAYGAAVVEADRVAREQRKAERKANHEERKATLKKKLGLS